MDFKIPGLPHSVVKHAQSASVRQLIQKIENHPNRHALQQDLRQNQSLNPFSPESKQMIRDVYIQLCELLETEPKTQCKACLSSWNVGIVCCTCGHFLRKGRGRISNLSSNSGVRNQELTTSRTSICKKAGRKGIFFSQPVEEKVQEEVLPGHP